MVASQDELHRRFGGVVPEIASRAHLERILPVIDEALRQAGMSLADLDAVAVANTPGLAGSLLVGLVAAKTLCVAWQTPLGGRQSPPGPHLCLPPGRRAAGGLSLRRADHQRRPHQPLSLPRAAGLRAAGGNDRRRGRRGLRQGGRDARACPIRAGRRSQRAAAGGNPAAPTLCPARSSSDDQRLDFSFSGLKTAVRYTIAGPGRPDFTANRAWRRNRWPTWRPVSRRRWSIAWWTRHLPALRRTGLRMLCVGGGVAANARLRQRLGRRGPAPGVRLHIAPLPLCTDNAVMGAIAIERLEAGLTEPLDLDVYPGVVRKGEGGRRKAEG